MVKKICKIKTKKVVFDFSDSDLEIRRNKEEQYLIEYVSIIVALNKKQDANFFLVFSIHYSELLDEFTRNDSIYIITQTSHVKNGIRTLKNQYFSPQNTLMRLFLSVPMRPACILGDAEQSWL